MKNCDYCGRENIPDAEFCRECGTAFPGMRKDPPPPSEPETIPGSPRDLAEKRMRRGMIWCIGGTFVTLFSYLAAAGGARGGSFVVAWGAIIFGALEYSKARKERDALSGNQTVESDAGTAERENIAYEALRHATRLESAGRVEEALATYQKIIEQFPGTGASNDAKKSIESLQARVG